MHRIRHGIGDPWVASTSVARSAPNVVVRGTWRPTTSPMNSAGFGDPDLAVPGCAAGARVRVGPDAEMTTFTKSDTVDFNAI